MKKEEKPYLRFDSISEAHRAFGLPQPQHPLISLIDNTTTPADPDKLRQPHVLTFFKISYRSNLSGRLKYGQGYYDFQEGGLLFASPNQLVSRHEDNEDYAGYTLLIHPDFILSYPLARKIRQYGFFSYSANEALHLSEKEKATVLSIFRIIEEELNSRIDDFSQDVIIAQIELLLNYANRFYKRQFITRKAVHNELLEKLEALLDDYFDTEKPLTLGIPTVQYLAEHLHYSPSYLSDMLRSLTGQSAQQHIHNKLIGKAKELLSATSLSVSEVAYQLGFEHPQSFSKLFRAKANLSPLEFRHSFN